MKNFIAIVHKDPDSAFGVSFPDLPGVFSAADTLEDVVKNAAEALELWFEDQGEIEPRVTVADILADYADDLAQGAFLVPVPHIPNPSKPVRVNISLDRGMLAAIDAAAEARHLTRSAWLMQAARNEIHQAH